MLDKLVTWNDMFLIFLTRAKIAFNAQNASNINNQARLFVLVLV